MTSVGIEEARKRLGDLVTRASQGTDTIISRNGRPVARITAYQTAYQEGPMLVTHTHQVTNPNQSGMITSSELAPGLADALLAANVDLDQIEVESDDTITVRTAGGRIVIGEEEGWITATAADDDGEAMIYEGTSISDLVAAVARTAS